MNTIEKLTETIISVCGELGFRAGYGPEETAILISDFRFSALYDALHSQERPLYSYIATDEGAMTLKYRSAMLFPGNASLLWKKPTLYIEGLGWETTRYLELWILEDGSLAAVSCVQTVYDDYITEYREYLGEQWPANEPAPDLLDFLDHMDEQIEEIRAAESANS